MIMKRVRGLVSTLVAIVIALSGMIAYAGKAYADSYNPDIVSFVTSLYSDCLGRQPDPTGLNDWCEKLTNHTISGKQAAYGFFFSPEFISKANSLSDGDLVDAYYKVFLNRSADPNGRDYWINQISGTTNDVSVLFTGFADSTEFAQKCASYGIEAGAHVDVPTTTRGTEEVSTPVASPTTNSADENLPFDRSTVRAIMNETNPYEWATREWAVWEADRNTRAFRAAYGYGQATPYDSGHGWFIQISGIDEERLYRDGWS